MKYIPALLFSLLISTGFAQQKWLPPVYQAFIQSDIPAWEQTLDSLQKAYRQSPSDALLLKLTRTQYGLAGYNLGVDKNEEGKKLLEKAWHNSGLLLQAHPDWTNILALRSGLTGYKITLAPYKAPVLGFESINYVKKALKKDSTCAVAWMEKGHIAFFASFLGYGYGKASSHYQKAVHYFEEAGNLRHNWLYMNSLVHLARAYSKQGKLEKARMTYEKILAIEPGFIWVKDELYPDLIKKLAEGNSQ